MQLEKLRSMTNIEKNEIQTDKIYQLKLIDNK